VSFKRYLKQLGPDRVDARPATIALVLVFVASSCAKPRKLEPPAPSPDPDFGKTSVRLLNRPEITPGDSEVRERLTPAYASDANALPEYPAYALKNGCRSGSVPVRVHINAEGNVSAQRDVPDHPLPNDACHVAFRAAVQAAVQGWRYAPAFHQRKVAGPDIDKDGKPDFEVWVQDGPVAIYIDYEFLFRVVNGKGEVRTR
jgi:hypothetical protein